MTGTAFSSVSSRSSYWQVSRAPRYSLLFALPLLVFYQVLAVLLAHGERSIRNGADAILQSLFTTVAGAWGPPLRGGVFAAMLGESIALALIFGFVVGSVTSGVLGMLQTLALPGGRGHEMDWWTRLMVSLGAGIYEELLFRVLLVGALAAAARALLGWRPLTAGIAATIAGAAIFSAFHYIGPYGDRWELYSFAFRMVAGLFFSGLYLARGFGITAWTHALYDVLLLLMQSG